MAYMYSTLFYFSTTKALKHACFQAYIKIGATQSKKESTKTCNIVTRNGFLLFSSFTLQLKESKIMILRNIDYPFLLVRDNVSWRHDYVAVEARRACCGNAETADFTFIYQCGKSNIRSFACLVPTQVLLFVFPISRAQRSSDCIQLALGT